MIHESRFHKLLFRSNSVFAAMLSQIVDEQWMTLRLQELKHVFGEEAGTAREIARDAEIPKSIRYINGIGVLRYLVVSNAADVA